MAFASKRFSQDEWARQGDNARHCLESHLRDARTDSYDNRWFCNEWVAIRDMASEAMA
ncbi:MAG TPA: hypothetical protein VK171_03530 [Fimbriimonas sp.]|nr:hypothetical protein [Fimbriimonas sp.]